MDPLTAIGLAANVAQFVALASQLISESKEIHASTKQCTSKVLTIESVYTRLRDVSASLELSSENDSLLMEVGAESNSVRPVLAIKELARTSKEDCDRLLEVARKLRGEERSRSRLQSFKIALKTVWKSREIADLEQRLHHVQAALTLHLCALTNHWNSIFARQLKDMHDDTKRLNLGQSKKLEDIARHIHDLGGRVAGVGQKPPAKSFEPADIESLQSQMSQLSMAKADVAKEHRILRSLSFESRPIRYASIAEAHQQTFEWVFREQGDQDERLVTASLLGWLQKESGIFWVSGKPGSGKSTLMKFVTDHPQTLQALSTWSYPKPAIIAKHFFWSAGTPMQKSWQGLFQTLLYEIFRQLPDLIDSTCIERWPKTLKQLGHETWHLPELRNILQRIADRQNLSTKFCFFIDGLDEFEGDHLEFCDVIGRLSKSPHVKLCVSSRPWNIFEDSFGRNPTLKLYMDRLTRIDIRTYVEDRLQQHPRWSQLKIEVENADWLINQITERASGVFLWVFLVTRQLRNGLTEYDSFSDMRRRLENIPTDLELFFKQILESVEPFYHEKMATTLQMALAARQPAPVAVYSFHDEEYEDEDFALKSALQPLAENQAASMLAHTTRRLNGRSRGLLEVHDSRVEFLHRTVMDYLRTPEMLSYLERKACAWFNANLSLLRGFTAYIKSTQFPKWVDRKDFANYTDSEFISILQEAIAHATLLGENPVAYKLLDHLEFCIPQIHETGQALLSVWGDSYNPVRLFFWEPAIKGRLVGYLYHVLPRLPDYFSRFSTSAESIMICLMVVSLTAAKDPQAGVDLLLNLLQACHHPSETYRDSPGIGIPFHVVQFAWKDTLQRVLPLNLTLMKPGSLSSKVLDRSVWKLEWTLEHGLFTFMLKHGADPNFAICGPQPSNPTPVWIYFVLLSFCISPQSSYQALYLQILDGCMATGNNQCAATQSACPRGPLLHGRAGLDLFLSHLSQTSAENYEKMDQPLLWGVFERLLIIANVNSTELEKHWPSLETAFPQQLISGLKSRFGTAGSGMRCRLSPHRSTQMEKRPVAGDYDDGPDRKKTRSAGPGTKEGDVLAVPYILHTDDYGKCYPKYA